MSPLLTIAIPTHNRAHFLREILQSILVQSHKDRFEVVVCDNASEDDTPEVVRGFSSGLDLKYFRSDVNLGFGGNYVRCLRNSTGNRIWVIGDDDALMPGAVGAILRRGGDLSLLAPIECDINLLPLGIRNWFGADPVRGFYIDMKESKSNLIKYMNMSQFEACVGAFISAMVLPGLHVVRHLEELEQHSHDEMVQLRATMLCLLEGCSIDWDPIPVFLNRLFNDGLAVKDPFKRSVLDLEEFIKLGRELKDPDVRQALYGIHRRNFNNSLPLYSKQVAPSPEAWEKVRALFLEAGYPEAICP